MSPTATSTSNSILSDNRSHNKDYPRSPSSISPTSSRRDSLRHRNAEPPVPNTPPVRLSRKRAASTDNDGTNHPRIQDLALSNHGIPESKTAVRTDHVCLCQPDPKIPRPRNAFILYRQHYQAQVVAQHPGLANPEISKIIGEQWRDQPIEVKNDWKRLADEEKQRHQRQYPDYRYQPRRAGKPAGVRAITNGGDENTRCPKCHGRFISTPSTPLPPFTPPFSVTRTLQPPFDVNVQGIQSRPSPIEVDRARYPSSSTAPHTATPYPEMHRRSQYSPPSAGLPMRDRERERERDESHEMVSPSTPFKRRRFDPDMPSDPRMHSRTPSYPPTPATYAPRRGPPAPVSAGGAGYPDDRRSGRVYQMQGYHNSPAGIMDPPPRPSPPYGYQGQQHLQHQSQMQMPMHQQHSPRNPNPAFDESLRLPPLQTQNQGQTSYRDLGPGTAGGAQRLMIDPRMEYQNLGEHHQRSLSVQAMVMTIPYLNKIKVLAKISPPLAVPGPTSPVQEVRGAVIAVEGPDRRLVEEVGRFLEECLGREGECAVRTWTGASSSRSNSASGSREFRKLSLEDITTAEKKTEDIEMSGVGNITPEVASLRLGSVSAGSGSDFLQYLAEIQAWHTKSREIAKFITTAPTRTPTPVSCAVFPQPASDGHEALSPKSLPKDPDAPAVETGGANDKRNPLPERPDTTNNPPSPSPSTSTTGGDAYSAKGTGVSSSTTPVGSSSARAKLNGPPSPTPIALLPTGFSLSTSDAYASSIAINDAYAPVDHWQWMATLWRGIIGPDLTIYVKPVDMSSDGGNGGSAGIGGSNSGEGMSGREEMGRFGGVEIRGDCRAVVVRVEMGQGSDGGVVEEKTLRRLGFEVLEFVRNEGGLGRA